jgi:hypothetical protein
MSPYRRARTRIGRALNHWAVWPVIVGLILGFALYGASDAHAAPDQAVVNYEQRYAPAVCAVLDEFPTFAGIAGIGDGIVEDDLVLRFVQRYSQAGSKTA